MRRLIFSALNEAASRGCADHPGQGRDNQRLAMLAKIGVRTMRAYAQFESGDDHLRLGAIFSLPATWWQRACFRTELRADIRDKPDFLRDIGISPCEAHAEASRFFWEPLLLKLR
jgi:uncharacterized protein YjiS (DUF1127 family)